MPCHLLHALSKTVYCPSIRKSEQHCQLSLPHLRCFLSHVIQNQEQAEPPHHSAAISQLPSSPGFLSIPCLVLTRSAQQNGNALVHQISLISVFCKLLVHIICRHYLSHFETRSVLSSLSHGLCRGSACKTQIIISTYNLLSSFDQRRQSEVTMLYLSWVFDTA